VAHASPDADVDAVEDGAEAAAGVVVAVLDDAGLRVSPEPPLQDASSNGISTRKVLRGRAGCRT